MRESVPDNHAGAIELLGLFACGELNMFGRLAADAVTMPTLPLRAELSTLAAGEMDRYGRLVERLVELGVDPQQVMEPFASTFDQFHARLAPSTWLEALVKAYVGDGISGDLYSAVAQRCDARTLEVVRQVTENPSKEAFLVENAGTAIAQNPVQVGRLSLWARRLFGEVVARGQRLAAEHDALGSLVVGGGGVAAVAGLSESLVVFEDVTARHQARMVALGLNP